jgi:hypothetical protein
MRVFLEEVMLNFPHVIDSEPVREFDLVKRILKQLQLRPFFPRTW